MSSERIGARRRDDATVDAAEKLERMARDVIAGVPKSECRSIVTAEDAATWDRLFADVALMRVEGLTPDLSIPLDEDDWGTDDEGGVVWLGEAARRAKQPKAAD